MTSQHLAGRWTALGHSFSMWSNDATVARHLADLYAALPGATPPSTSDYGVEVVEGEDPGGEAAGRRQRTAFVVHDPRRASTPKHSLGRALAVLGSRLNRAVITLPHPHPLLHASAAALDGAAVALPAAMESGKSTLVAGLVRAGWSYLTDEAVLLEGGTLSVEGLLKPISLDPGSWNLFPEARPDAGLPSLASVAEHQWQVAPGRLGKADPVRRARLAAIVFPRHVERAETTLEPLRKAEVLEGLLHCAFGTAGSRTRFDELADVARALPGYRLISGSLVESIDAVSTALEESLAIGT